MKIEIHQEFKSLPASSTLVLFVNQPKADSKGASKGPLCHNMPTELKKMFSGAVEELVLTGASGEIVFFRDHSFQNFKHILFVGLGAWDEENHETLRSLGGSLEGAITGNKLINVVLKLDTITEAVTPIQLQGLVEGLGLAAYRFDELISAKKDKPKEVKVLLVLPHLTKSHKEAFEHAKILIESVCFSRRLGDLPGNLMTPTILANETKAAAKGTKIKTTVWDRSRIKKERLGGLLCVAQGSNEPPCFIMMEYKGAKTTQKPLVFVGKGLTFDTGGLSIKPSAGMEEMKYDMCGGANVIGAIIAMAKMKLKVNVVALVPATENMSGGSAIKPGDIVRARNGKTYEVNNTDAEGRLILSDALCIASEMKPQMIVDAATLTGAMVVALGNTHTGFFTKNSDLKIQIEDAAKLSGEWVWQMPLCDFHSKDMKGTFADLSNLAASRGAGSATAAAFLEQFVDKDIPWAHFDIAGTGWATGNRLTYTPKKGASGVMLRTFVELAKLYE
jgi:leucyl aminopeptidase